MITAQSKMRHGSLLVVLVVALAGCGGGEGGDRKAATQVAARVNGEEITVHQVNLMLQRLGPTTEAQAREASRQVLNSLVEQEIVLQKALKEKIDRDPQVVQVLDAMRRQVLVQAYLERLAKGYTPSDAEVKAYFAQSPGLFAQRKIYRFNEIVALPRPEQVPLIEARLKSRENSMSEIALWLREQRIPFRAGASERAAEQLPLDAINRLGALKPGEKTLVAFPNGLGILELVSTVEQPVTEEQAKPAIQRFLVNQKRFELAQAELKQLREAAKIEYVGKFAELAKAEPGKSATAQAPAAPAQGTAPTAAAPDAKTLERGLSGL